MYTQKESHHAEFDAYRVTYTIEKHGRNEYQLFASKARPRFIVREDFPNGLVTELSGISSGFGSACAQWPA